MVTVSGAAGIINAALALGFSTLAATTGTPPATVADTGGAAKATRALAFPMPRVLPATRRTTAAGSGPATALATSLPEPPAMPLTAVGRDEVAASERGCRATAPPAPPPAPPSSVDAAGTDVRRPSLRSPRDPPGVARVAPGVPLTVPCESAADDPPATSA